MQFVPRFDVLGLEVQFGGSDLRTADSERGYIFH